MISWNARTTPPTQIIYEGVLQQAIQRVGIGLHSKQASPTALLPLIMDDELGVRISSPFYGAADFLANGNLKLVVWHTDIMSGEELGTPLLEHLTVRQEFLEEHPDAALGAVEALNETMTWLHESRVDKIPGDEDFQEAIAADSRESLEYASRWIRNDPDVAYPIETEAVYEDVTVTDEWVSGIEIDLDNGGDIGAVPKTGATTSSSRYSTLYYVQ